jgi:hypothetical protein
LLPGFFINASEFFRQRYEMFPSTLKNYSESNGMKKMVTSTQRDALNAVNKPVSSTLSAGHR